MPLPFFMHCVKILLKERDFMKKLTFVAGTLGVAILSSGAYALSAGTVGASDMNRSVSINTATTQNARGYQGLANAYKANQKNTYFMVTQPDVDSACREKIYNCLAEYCGDVTVVNGQASNRCQYATETELYNYALLCLQKDTTVLLPQYNTSNRTGAAGMNTAATLCPPYVQQELMSYLSMANMADKLSKSRSDLCIQRRQELEAAMACYSAAMAYGNETSSKLTSVLNDYCGAGVPGGSAEMVTRFANAGNVGANVWGWAEKIVSLDLNKKDANWQNEVNAILVSYTNKMNLACGDDMVVNTVPTTGSSNSTGLTAVQTVATLALGGNVEQKKVENPYANVGLFKEYSSLIDIWDYSTAYQVVQSAFSNYSTTQNAYFTTGQLDDMQTAYKRGTKVFIIKDSARCYIVPVAQLTDTERSLVSQTYASCISK